MGTLFLKECRQILKSLVYYIFLVVFVLDITSQMKGAEWMNALKEPQPGQEDYGYDYTTDPDAIMESGIETLYEEVSRNSFSTYPFGFYKEVKLGEKKLSLLKAAVEDCTGKTMEELDQLYTDYWIQSENKTNTYEEYMQWEMGWHIPIRADYAYRDFEKLMQKANDMVGKGSAYDEKYKYSAMAPVGYEQAKKSYDDLCFKDRVSGAQMRLFCDYAGIFLAILPIFVGVSACLRDKRAKAAEVIYARQISGAKLILCRYFANVVMMFLPVAACAFLLQMPCVYAAGKMGIAADQFAFLKYSLLWLLPEIMVMLAVAFLLTEATETILAIPIQFIWAAASIFSATTLKGNFGWKLVARWNLFGGYSDYAEEAKQLYLNRGWYLALSVIAILLTVIVYRRKRGGQWNYGKTRKGNH